jgi:fatty-acyl-CoA synthase
MTAAETGLAYLVADTSTDLIDVTVGQLLVDQAARFPTRTALVGTSHDGSDTRLTYAELLDEASRVATALRRLADPGAYVALWAPNVTEWPIIQYGAALAGVVLVAVNPAFSRRELEYVLTHSRSAALIHADRVRDVDLAEVVRDVSNALPDLTTVSLTERDRWRADAVDAAVLANAPTDARVPVMLQYTSGTTGDPKGVLLRHRSLVNVARLTMQFVGVADGAVCLNPLPMFHTAACVIGTLGPLSIAGTEVLIRDFAPAPVLAQMRTEHVSVLFYVPAVLSALLDAQRGGSDPAPTLTTVMGGAANVPASLIESAEDVFGAAVINLFGQTELAPVLSATRPDDSRADQLGTVGHPLPHVDVKIVDPATGGLMPFGVPGEICARGYQQLVEYLHDPDATAATVDADGFVHTGDLGALDERGYLTLSGRLKELIIRGGENIAPADVENVLAAHPLVLSAAVVGLPDDRMGEIVACVIRVRGDEPTDLRDQLIGFLRERVARFKIPSRWFVAPELPLTSTGKVQKFRVVDAIAAGGYRELADG